MSETVLKVGSGEQYTTINAAILAANNMGGNADIQVDAGTYVNDGGYLWDGINNVTIEGVGGTVRIVDPTYYAGGKAAIVTGGNNIVLKNLDISGVQVPDANGAAVRYDQGSLTLINDHFHDNQNGILGGGDSTGSITIENSSFDHNGVGGNGHTHDIYIGHIANFTLKDSVVTDAEIGHEVKSRAENNTITDNVIADDSETASYTIDLPNGGNATITGNTIEQGALTQNSAINAYGEEGASDAGNSVNFSNNTVINDGPNGPLWSGGGGNFTGSGNNFYNVGNLGQAGSVGYTTDSTRPALNIPGYSDTTPVSTTTDTITLSLSEDAWQGDAKADILVDGVAYVRNQVITASHAAGQDQTVTVSAPSASSHVISVAFTNDAWDGTSANDRNLYIDGISVNGVSTGQSAPEDGGGIESFTVSGSGASATTTTISNSGGTTTPGDDTDGSGLSTGSSGTAPTLPTPGTATFGTGSDQIVLHLSEDAYDGNAVMAISVDGQQLTSDYEIQSLHSAGQDDTVTLNVAPAMAHDLQVTFTNDEYEGTPNTDRNAYVDSVSVNGQTVSNATAAMDSAGTTDFTIPGTAPTLPTPSTATFGTGSDQIVLHLSEDAYDGNAVMAISVDGQQLTSDYEIQSLHSAGQNDTVTLNVAPAMAHDLQVTFTNDKYDGTPNTDRNAYVDSATINGVTVSGQQTLLSDGTANFSLNAADPTPVVTSELTLNVSEDAYQGDGQMVVSVDGQSMGYYTVTASHAAGQSQTITISNITESFTQHDIAVSFVNDAYGGTPSTDRNLYLNSMQFDGTAVNGGSATYMSNGSQHFTATAPVNWTGQTGA